MRITYTDGRTGLTTTAFRYKLTDPDGTLVKDWTTGATWTEEPAGTYYLDDAAAVPGTVYAVEPSEGEVGGVGRVALDPDNDSIELALAILRNKTVDAGTTVTLYDDDGTTVLGTWTWDAAGTTRGRLT